MKLTKSQRHVAYIIMLAEAELNKTQMRYGVCMLAHKLFGFGEDDGVRLEKSWESNLKYFPEYKRKQPKGTIPGSTWFGFGWEAWDKRIVLLKQCIIETY